MRPKKVILLIDSDELRRSVTSCVLYVNSYRVIAVHTPREALALAPERVDGVVAYWPLDESLALICAGKHDVKLLIVEAPEGAWDRGHADSYLPKGKGSEPLQLLDRMKWMMRVNRGPKKGSVRAGPKPVPICSLSA